MKRKANPALIGAFVVVGLAVLAVAVIGLAGNAFFARKERAVMHFSGSVYGLQVGAPVVFRGVRVGSVSSIEVVYDRSTDRFSIPVVAELEGDAVSSLDGQRASADVALALPALVQRGLSAQLAMQSLLTGLLYVDLDLRPPSRSGAVATSRGSYRGLTEIPTSATAIQALKNQFEGMDFRKVADDLSAIAASARAVVSGPQLQQALTDLAAIAATAKRVSDRLDRRVDPLANELQSTLAAARAALQQLGQAASSVDDTSRRLGRTSDRFSDLVAPDAPLVQGAQGALGEVGRAASALRDATGGDSALVRGTERTLQDVSRAARALRNLAETLEQQPDALLRGRQVPE